MCIRKGTTVFKKSLNREIIIYSQLLISQNQSSFLMISQSKFLVPENLVRDTGTSVSRSMKCKEK